MEREQTTSRPESATSSLDPYYFGIQSESESPLPPLPPVPMFLSTTPDPPPQVEPVTPARNPASIDRRGLVGVGELATPRWAAREDRNSDFDEPRSDHEAEGYDLVVPEDMEEDQPDSPWTIEAVDGETSEREEVPNMQPQARTLRARPSIADESGGEEILYPRNLAGLSDPLKLKGDFAISSSDGTPKVPRVPEFSSMPEDNHSTSPPSAFNQSTRKARKRTSDEFELDQTGSLVSKRVGSTSSTKDKVKDDKASVRKHRSLNAGAPVSRDGKGKERRRESVGLTINSTMKSPLPGKTPDRHVRQTSASSTSSNVGDSHHSRRVHTTDFSHLPPSPSSSSIQQFLRNTANAPTSQATSLHRSSKDNLQMHSSPSVAHSLLRGTQEGWSGLDDEATAEALRKLDGLTGKGARARASVGSFGRPSSSSRPGTPAGKSSTQWEGVNTSDSGRSKRGSGGLKESPSIKDKGDYTRAGNPPLLAETLDVGDTSVIVTSSDEQSNKSNPNTRLSFTPKRGSTSSTTYTSTPSSPTSVTSMSVMSGGRRRNSASSDISSHSAEAAFLKDRVASIAVNGELTEEGDVPPVPPLPKDLSTYRSPPSTSSGLAFPTIPSDDRDKAMINENQSNRAISLDVPVYTSPIISPPTSGRRESQHYSSNSTNEPAPAVLKTPSKKWSFSSALNLKLSGSPSSSSQKTSFPLSPRSVTFGQQLRKSSSKDQQISASSSSKGPWSPNQPEAMASAGSLTSLSSVGSVRTPAQIINPTKTPDRAAHSSRPGTAGSSASTNLAPATLAAPILSPTSSRLTPSSIPFFRRSSSQSMQIPPANGALSSTSPTYQSMISTNQLRPKQTNSPSQDLSSISTSTPGTTHKKSSILGGRSLHADAKDAAKEIAKELQRAKEAARESEKERQKQEKERQKKEDKDRSESRISVIINRKRGKTLSSTDPRKPKSPVNLPPMQMSALEPVTAQRVAKLKSSTTTSAGTSSRASTSSTSSRLTSQTVSSMQKQSDTSLRSRNQLPTIAGSPSVGTTGTSSSQTLKDGRDATSSLNSSSGLPKETPTKIPRISSRTSAVPSPPNKSSGSALGTRRASGLALLDQRVGVMESEDGATPKVQPPSIRSSPLPAPASRVPRQTPNVSSTLSLLAPKTTARASTSGLNQSVRQTTGSPSSSRQSLSTPSPVPSTIDEEELLGDEEMLHYIRRQHAKKLATGANQEELDEMLKFPEPVAPGTPSSPASKYLEKSSSSSTSEYERKEILDYPSVYCIGADSKKKLALLNDTTNNYGYDDERGDYLVVNHDHLAYRYEIIDTLGKGSFGQVLHLAVKIIRNKKRFHHQAIVEIKILDNLRKWDAEEKHHVIKMNEHFYFRNHLCIAMELLSINLYELIKANGFVGFTTALIRRFTSQMLLSLSLMRHHRIVHCDLKPENVLLRHPAKSGLKVIDFGSSCFEHEKIYTYIQSRFYRSPEVILGMNYHMAIDMLPIFPGENEQEQLSCIMEVLGVPDKEFINRSSRRKLFFDTNGAPRTVINSKGRRRRPGTKTLAQVLRCNDEEFVDFVAKCLVWDPERRMKPQTALRHPFVTAGKRVRPAMNGPKSTPSSSTLGARSKQLTETPKKSLISAPTPLTARSSRTATTTNGVPTSPNTSFTQSVASGSSQTSRSYRASQSQSLSFNSSRTLSGYAFQSSTTK
ncbi:hypothetical protein BJ912DRAFT_1020757 [Pholiota molesta]|nr:hypothetical protein BJ912DRAFT_1020757 [Pholiota molesta]